MYICIWVGKLGWWVGGKAWLVGGLESLVAHQQRTEEWLASPRTQRYALPALACFLSTLPAQPRLTLSREALGPIGPSIFKGQQLKT